MIKKNSMSSNLIISGIIIFAAYLLKKYVFNKSEKKELKTIRSDEGGKERFFNKEDAETALKKIAEKYGKETAQVAERILRHETAHFTSGQYRKTGSAGMEVGKWAKLPQGMRTVKMLENNTGKIKEFIVWDSVYDFLVYLIEYAKRHEGNWSRWYSTKPDLQAEYRKRVNSVTNRTIV